jgi:hypothetical protein
MYYPYAEPHVLHRSVGRAWLPESATVVTIAIPPVRVENATVYLSGGIGQLGMATVMLQDPTTLLVARIPGAIGPVDIDWEVVEFDGPFNHPAGSPQDDVPWVPIEEERYKRFKIIHIEE